MSVGKVKVKGAPGAVRQLLSGGVDTAHGKGTLETRKKVKQAQQYNPRQKPGSGPAPARWELAEQPTSGM